jgi:iron complex outermembrane receptor protein
MRAGFILAALALHGTTALAGQSSIRIEVRSQAGPVAAAEIVVNGATHRSDASGLLVLNVPAGIVQITVVKEGFAPATTSVDVGASQQRSVEVELVPTPTVEEHVTVSATRTDQRLEDVPMRVEVLAREEIEEKMLMTPGDIVMMLNEMGGMRVQATSPSLGAASVRIQGMRGRYTRFLSDGLPLFGEQVGGLGLLQIPPMDLGQVEVIKGVASALYGAGAMGGVVNLVSRRPGDDPFTDLLVNRSTRGATDAVLFTATPFAERWRVSLLGGGHWQELVDVDDDAWADLPRYSRGVVRPRVFWDGGGGRTFFATVGATFEDRVGGTLPGGSPAVGGNYQEALETARLDAGAVGQVLLRDRYVASFRAATARQRHRHEFGDARERDRHLTSFGEVAVRGTSGAHTWVVGAAVERDDYDPRDVRQFAYAFTAPGVFVQDDVNVADWVAVSVSGRVDRHSEYGTFFSPRVSAVVRGGGWTARASAGAGFFGTTFLSEETEAAGLSRLAVPNPLVAEKGRSASVDVTREVGPASMTLTLFASRVKDPIDVDRAAGLVLTNSPDPTTNAGVELLGVVRRAPFALTGTYTFVDARETESGRRVAAALTPRHSAGLVGMLEAEDAGRVGLEVYYTGRQRLEYNPYRDVSRPYVSVGFLAERRFGRIRVFLNAENITDVRQTRWDPVVRPARAPDGRWTVDGWAPLDGRTFNGGVRIGFGGE